MHIPTTQHLTARHTHLQPLATTVTVYLDVSIIYPGVIESAPTICVTH